VIRKWEQERRKFLMEREIEIGEEGKIEYEVIIVKGKKQRQRRER